MLNNNYIQKIYNYLFQHEFLRYSVSGGTAAIIDFSVFIILTRAFGIYYIYANILAFITANIVNYSINRAWTFKSKSEKVLGQFLSFCTIGSIGLLINTAILFMLVEYVNIDDIVGKIIATAVVFLWNYFMNKHITFKRI